MFNENNALVIDYESDGDLLKLYIKQPSKDRIEACAQVFRFIYKNKEEYNTDILSTDFDLIVKEASKNNQAVLLNFKGFVEECIQNLKVVSPKKGLDFVSGYDFFDKLSDDDKNILKATIVFQYTLLRYLPQAIVKKELSEFYTASTLEEYQNAYMKSIEAMENSSMK